MESKTSVPRPADLRVTRLARCTDAPSLLPAPRCVARGLQVSAVTPTQNSLAVSPLPCKIRLSRRCTIWQPPASAAAELTCQAKRRVTPPPRETHYHEEKTVADFRNRWIDIVAGGGSNRGPGLVLDFLFHRYLHHQDVLEEVEVRHRQGRHH